MATENEQPEPVQIAFAKGTDVGRSRDHNEDYLDAFSPPDPAERRRKGDLFVVADGMGGHQAGDVASQSAVRVFSHEYYADPETDVRGSLVRAIKKANAYIHQQAQQLASRAGMGTTIVTAVVRGQEVFLANVGDSRAYLVRQGKISQVTRDHSFVAEQVRAGILTVEEARAHPQRNVITRALGSKPEVEVDTYSGELRAGDTLLLCSDGLSEYVHEEDMLSVLTQYPAQEAISQMIAMANKRGGSDNISVLVVQATSPASIVTTQKAVPVVQPSTQSAAVPARKSVPLPWIIGIVGVVVLGAAALIVGIIFVPSLFRGQNAPTPTASVAPSPTRAPTVTPAPTATARVAEGDPTATPLQVLRLQEPEDEASYPAGEVTFSWNPIGLTGLITFAVKSETGELCNTTKEAFCDVDLLSGDYTWWVEGYVDGKELLRSDLRSLHIEAPSTPSNATAPTLPSTPMLTTAPPAAPPGGGANSGDGDPPSPE